ncbi:MAG: Gldg family protein [Burkholderiales bacterium]
MKKGLYSSVGVIVVLIAIVAINYALGLGKQRIDLTKDKLFSLSEGTRKALANLKDPITIKFYYTQGDDTIPIQVRTFAKRTEDLLSEYKQAASGKVVIEKLNPQPDSDAEDAATVDGIDGQVGPSGDRFYLGLAIVQGEQKAAIPSLSADRERLIEYDLTRAITRVATKEKPVIGVMTPLPVTGNPMAMMMGQGGPQPPQIFYSEMEKDYKVERVGLDAEEIKPEIKTLLVIHPRGISDQAQYAIDQFILRGGRLIAFVDPHAYLDQIPGMPQFQGGTSSSLDKLFKAWGVEMDTGKIVLDLENAAGQGQRMMPTVLALDGPYINRTDVATSLIPNSLIPMAGAFGGQLVEGLSQTVLLKSSKNSQLIDGSTAADKRGQEAIRSFASGGKELAIAIKVSGKFKTAFPDGRPVKEEPKKDAKDDKKDASAKKAAPKPLAAPVDANQLKEAKEENTVVLFADSDFLQDGAAVQIQEMFGRRIAIPANGNLPLFQAVVEQMAGDPTLINLASRSIATRPLTVVKQMEAEAQQAYLGKMKELEDSLNQTKEKLTALEKKPAPGQKPDPTTKVALTPEQQEEVDNFRKRVVETRKELKDVRRDLRADSEALQFWTKVLNIAFMPIIVTIAGILIGLLKRRRLSRAMNPVAA